MDDGQTMHEDRTLTHDPPRKPVLHLQEAACRPSDPHPEVAVNNLPAPVTPNTGLINN